MILVRTVCFWELSCNKQLAVIVISCKTPDNNMHNELCCGHSFLHFLFLLLIFRNFLHFLENQKCFCCFFLKVLILESREVESIRAFFSGSTFEILAKHKFYSNLDKHVFQIGLPNTICYFSKSTFRNKQILKACTIHYQPNIDELEEYKKHKGSFHVDFCFNLLFWTFHHWALPSPVSSFSSVSPLEIFWHDEHRASVLVLER
ncbi:hypothetical protein H5410_038309 [Solanum commersonii]|uniref:Uncharacterized protein n=1 Tax=Solanum commersonii TaxID=4109 RepID=A0A9J5YAC6_SOLCO|nr:hypothetical protein H5410_038309 [Solanum commersonii]